MQDARSPAIVERVPVAGAGAPADIEERLEELDESLEKELEKRLEESLEVEELEQERKLSMVEIDRLKKENLELRKRLEDTRTRQMEAMWDRVPAPARGAGALADIFSSVVYKELEERLEVELKKNKELEQDRNRVAVGAGALADIFSSVVYKELEERVEVELKKNKELEVAWRSMLRTLEEDRKLSFLQINRLKQENLDLGQHLAEANKLLQEALRVRDRSPGRRRQ
jgi:hypothetical protein